MVKAAWFRHYTQDELPATFERVVQSWDTAVQQLPGFTIGVDPPAADDSRIEEIEALVARPIDLPILFRDQHRLSLVDGDLWWAGL